MKGLLVKDIQLLLQRKQTLLLLLAVCLLVGFSTNGTFIIGYMVFISALISLSTISYDDADNGMPFLMTLPVSRKTYALSKYLLSGISCVGSWALSLVIMRIINAVKGQAIGMRETMILSVLYLLIGLLIPDLMIPLQLKYGAEKSRIVMFILLGGAAAAIALMERSGIMSVSVMLDAMDRIPDAWFAAGLVTLYAVLTIVSTAVSIRVMKHKAF